MKTELFLDSLKTETINLKHNIDIFKTRQNGADYPNKNETSKLYNLQHKKEKEEYKKQYYLRSIDRYRLYDTMYRAQTKRNQG